MKYVLSTAFIFSCFLMTFSLTAQEGRSLDSLELVKFYEATDGDNWAEPWKLDLPMERWEGVGLNEIGRLITLNVNNNNLTGTLIDFNLPFLKTFICSKNDISGNIPNFKSLPSLITLECWGNKLSGNLPNFSNLPLLETLDIVLNDLDGSIPNFTNLPNLTVFDCGNNNLTGSIPDFSNLPLLKELKLKSNVFTGLITNFSNLPLLILYDCSSNELTNSIPDFSNLPNLEIFKCSGNNLTGKIPNFSNLPKLEEFWCDRNKLIDTIPDFSNLPNLRELNCGGNYLTGKIPDFSNLTKIKRLWISGNELEGKIPDFSKMSTLSYLECTGNNLSGKLPDFSNLPNISTLSCRNNQFIGSVPNLKNTPKLIIFSVNGNQFTDISTKLLENNPQLEDLGIHENKLTFENIMPFYEFTKAVTPISTSRPFVYEYQPQDSIYLDTIFNTYISDSLIIDLQVDGEINSNIYTWYKNETSYQTIEGSNKLTFQNIQASDAGIYTVEVTNPNLPDLTLYSYPITIQVNEELENQLETTITASDKEGASDETISIPIMLKEVPAIAALEGTLQLSNPQIGQMVGIEPGLIEDILFNTTTGQFNWFDASGEGVALSNDTLFYVQVTLAGEQGDSSLLSLDAVKVWSFENENLTEVAVLSQAGKIKIVNNISLLGRIQNYQNKGINQTAIILESTYSNTEKTDTTYSLPDGSYELAAVRLGSDLTIQPSKTGNSRNGLSSLALFLAQRHLLGFDVAEINSPFQLAAGDANCDGRFSVVDLFLIQRMIVGVDEQFANCPNWKFTPASEAANFVFNTSTYYPNYPFPTEINLTNQRATATVDFIGMKTGDILNRADLSSFRTNVGAKQSSVRSPLRFYFSEQEIVTGDTFCVDLGVAEFQNIGSIQFSLEWDTSTVQLQGAQTILENANLNVNNSLDGQLSISWFDIEGQGISFPDSTNLLEMCFVALTDTDGTTISFTDNPTPIEVAEFDGSAINILEVEQTEIDLVIASCDPIDLGEDVFLCSGNIVNLDATFQINTTYDWYKDGNLIASDSLGQLAVDESGIYLVKKNITSNCVLIDTIQVKLLENEITFEENFVCGMVAARTDTLRHSNQNGCDSLVVISYLPANNDTSLMTSYTCFPEEVSRQVKNFVTESGCDSILIEEIILQTFEDSFTVVTTDINCIENTAQIIINNLNEDDTPFLYSIDQGQTFTTEPIFSNIKNGNYEIIVENPEGCQQTLPAVIIGDSPQLKLPENLIVSLGDSVQLNPEWTNVNNPTFIWSPTVGLSCSDCPYPMASPIQSEAYILSLVGENGCTFEQTVNLRVLEELNLFVPDAFSPNDDGRNDTLSFFEGKSIAAITEFKVFDRWGALVFNGSQIENNLVWDGFINGNKANIGTYIYKLSGEKLNGKSFVKTGTVNLVR